MAGFDFTSRYALTEEAVRAPGMDIITSSTVGPFVDTGRDVNKFDPMFMSSNGARIYLSVSSLREMAEGAGLFEELRSQLAAAESRPAEEEKEEEHELGLSDVIRRIDALGDRCARCAGETDETEQPTVFTTDGGVGDSELGTDGAADVRASGQSNHPSRNRRPSSVSAGAGIAAGLR